MNNYIDWDIDPIMKRTKSKPTFTGTFKQRHVLTITLSLIIVGEILLFIAAPAAGMWGLAGIIAYIVLYSMWSKRKFVGNTIVGSISGAIPPLIGWMAVESSLGLVAIALFLIMFTWQPTYFYTLAIKRTDEYRAANIPMLPVIKGFFVNKSFHDVMDFAVVSFTIPFGQVWYWLHNFSNTIECDG